MECKGENVASWKCYHNIHKVLKSLTLCRAQRRGESWAERGRLRGVEAN